MDYYPNPFLRIPEFLIGMMSADISEEVGVKNWLNKKRCRIILVLISVGATVGLTLLRPYFMFETNLYNIIVVPCTAICFLVIANWEWLNRIISTKLVRWLASLGLEMYLCQSFSTLVLSHIEVSGQWDVVVFILLSIGFAVIVHTCFCKPINSATT